MKVKKKLLNLIRSAFEYFFFFALFHSDILRYSMFNKNNTKDWIESVKSVFFFLVGNLPKRFVAYYYIRWHLSFSATYIDQYRKTLVFCFRPLMSMLQLASIFFFCKFLSNNQSNQQSNTTTKKRVSCKMILFSNLVHLSKMIWRVFFFLK